MKYSILIFLMMILYSCGSKVNTKQEQIILNSLKNVKDYNSLGFSDADTLDIYKSSMPGSYLTDSINKYNGIIDSLRFEKLFHNKNTSLEQAKYYKLAFPFETAFTNSMINAIKRKPLDFRGYSVVDTAYRISHCYTSSDGKHCVVYVVNTNGRIVKSEEYQQPYD